MTEARLEAIWAEPGGIRGFLTTVDHKQIGVRYLVTGFAFFLAAGIEALLMRTQLAGAWKDVLDPAAYDQVMTLHGVTMIFLFITPVLSGGFGNYFVPLLIGTRDMAFPRLNAFSYWVFLAAGIFIYTSVLYGASPNAGWFNYVPLAAEEYNPGKAIDYYVLGLVFLTIATTAGAINLIVTIFKLRAPGMSINRMPLFCWAQLVTSFAIVFALPALTAANTLLWLQRTFDFDVFDPAKGGDPLLWQHLFWIFGHPDVYIIFLPAVGIVSTVIPVMSRRPIVGYTLVALATVLIGIVGFGVWVHHMFAVGLPQVSMTFFSAASLLVAVPSGIQVFAWLATVLAGRPVVTTAMLYALGFVVVFVIGGVTGVMFAVVPFDQQTTDSYFVVAHFHYVLFGGAVFPVFAGLYYWLPKITGRLLSETLGKASFWVFFVGFNLTFFPMHISGLLGMPRRIYTYHEGLGWEPYNLASTIGAFLLAAGILLTLANIVWSRRAGRYAGDDPWGGDTLEWTVSSPPPDYNFPVVPTVRSATPNWDSVGGELALADGHQVMTTTVLDGESDRVLEMPSESPVPALLALSLAIVFGGLLLEFWAMAVIGAALVVGALLAWGWPRVQGSDGLGWWGMVGLVATEATLFGVLLAAYYYIRFQAGAEWPPEGIPEPSLLRPGWTAAVLVLSSVPMALAARSARPHLWLVAAWLLGAAFLGLQADAIAHSSQDLRPQDHAYAALLYTIVVGHSAHVFGGLLLNAWSLIRSTRVALAASALYWHFVNVLAIVVYLALYLAPGLGR